MSGKSSACHDTGSLTRTSPPRTTSAQTPPPHRCDITSRRPRQASSIRSQGRVSPTLHQGDITLDPARRSVTRAGEPVTLSVSEYRTLLALMERRGRVLTRGQLEDAVYGSSGHIESNTIAVYVHQLRRKLGDGLIATVHGFGYRIGEEGARA